MTTLNTTDRYTERGYTYKEGATRARASNRHNTTHTYTQKHRRNSVSYIVRFTCTPIQTYMLMLDDTCMVILLYRKGIITKCLYLADPTKLERGKEHISSKHLQKKKKNSSSCLHKPKFCRLF